VAAPPEPPSSGPVFFVITVRNHAEAATWTVDRRYSECDALKSTIAKRQLAIAAHPLPPKHPQPGYDVLALAERASGLESWAHALLSDADALGAPEVLTFFGLPESEAPP